MTYHDSCVGFLEGGSPGQNGLSWTLGHPLLSSPAPFSEYHTTSHQPMLISIMLKAKSKRSGV